MGVVEVIEVSLLFVEVTSLQKSKSLRVVPHRFFSHWLQFQQWHSTMSEQWQWMNQWVSDIVTYWAVLGQLKTGPSPKIRGVKKKRHGHNFQNFGSISNQRGTNHVGPMLIQWRRSKLKIVAVSFFLTPILVANKIGNLSGLWKPITMVENL